MNHCHRERVIKTIHLKEDPLEKRVINSENSKEKALIKNYPLRSKKKTESKTADLKLKLPMLLAIQ